MFNCERGTSFLLCSFKVNGEGKSIALIKVLKKRYIAFFTNPFVASSSEVAKLTSQKIAVTLIQSKEMLMIAGEGSPDYIFSGSSKALKEQQEFKATNMSTESAYSLNVSFKKNNGVSQSTDISINRVTGAILVTKQTLIGSYLNSVDLAGFCKKMSSANKF